MKKIPVFFSFFACVKEPGEIGLYVQFTKYYENLKIMCIFIILIVNLKVRDWLEIKIDIIGLHIEIEVDI